MRANLQIARYLTRQLLDGARVTFADPKLSVISYGPCQTPTLAFTTRWHDEIEAFVPREFWGVDLRASIGSGGEMALQWKRPVRHHHHTDSTGLVARRLLELTAVILADVWCM